MFTREGFVQSPTSNFRIQERKTQFLLASHLEGIEQRETETYAGPFDKYYYEGIISG